jgi:pyruvate formate lyase activating enzyme
MTNLVTNIQGYSIHDGPGIRTVVFLKGCGLACEWCANPECISTHPEIGFFKTLCTKCGKCAEICPNSALSFNAGKYPQINRDRCTGCGVCSEACAYKAIVLYGKPMDADGIYDAVSRDKMFYEASGGGITVSGGEALLYPQLVQDVFEKCRKAGINTCIETSGYIPESALKQVLHFTDFLLYDLKLMNAEKHLEHTGKSNDLVHTNARTAAESGVKILFRMPLIPGINDDTQNLKEMADFLGSFSDSARRLEIMPYHRLGKGKYESIGRTYRLASLLPPTPKELASVKNFLEDAGIICTISE